MSESRFAWATLLYKYVDKVNTTEELEELNRQKETSIFKQEQFTIVTAEGYFQKAISDLLAIDREAALKGFEEKLGKHIGAGEASGPPVS
jgi:hypothetical protein